jgi:hypothetical protein
MVLLGVDQATRVATMGLPRRTDVYLVGGERTASQAQQWSMQLGAALVTLPSSASWLSDAVSNAAVTGRRPVRLSAWLAVPAGWALRLWLRDWRLLRLARIGP